jgi:hypothetical protein
MPRETVEFPMVALVEGGLTTDGEQVLLQLMTVEDGPIHFGLRLADMESFVTFLLQMAASVSASSCRAQLLYCAASDQPRGRGEF